MSIPARFVEVARGKLEQEVFDEIYARAVDLEREAAINQPTYKPAGTPALATRVEAHLNDQVVPQAEPIPHIAERLYKRLDIQVEQTDLEELLDVIRLGGPNVKTVRQSMEMTMEAIVQWRGKEFTVLYRKVRDKLRLITAYPRKKKRQGKITAQRGRPKDWRAEQESAWND